MKAVAKKALMELWRRRSHLGLVGNVINVTSGLWTWRDAGTFSFFLLLVFHWNIHFVCLGIGAGVDSFYEYLFKSFLLFGDREYYIVFREVVPQTNSIFSVT
jgi:hypothetical protein